MAWSVNFAAAFPLAIGDWTFPGYTALYTLILNLVVAIVLTPVMNALGSKHSDTTAAADYYA
jgi:SSS family solute:Na+ symporter